MYEMFNRDLIASTQTATNYAYFGICARKLQKPVVKHSIEKPILLNLRIYLQHFVQDCGSKQKRLTVNDLQIIFQATQPSLTIILSHYFRKTSVAIIFKLASKTF